MKEFLKIDFFSKLGIYTKVIILCKSVAQLI